MRYRFKVILKDSLIFSLLIMILVLRKEKHFERTFNTNLEYPIALVTDSRGVDRVLDGNHRLLQALVRDVNSVKVVKVINPDFVLNNRNVSILTLYIDLLSALKRIPRLSLSC